MIGQLHKIGQNIEYLSHTINKLGNIKFCNLYMWKYTVLFLSMKHLQKLIMYVSTKNIFKILTQNEIIG